MILVEKKKETEKKENDWEYNELRSVESENKSWSLNCLLICWNDSNWSFCKNKWWSVFSIELQWI